MQEVARAAEKSGMSTHSTENETVFILHFTLDHAMTEDPVIFRRRNGASQVAWWLEERILHLQGKKNLAPAENIQWSTGNSLKHSPQQDEA